MFAGFCESDCISIFAAFGNTNEPMLESQPIDFEFTRMVLSQLPLPKGEGTGGFDFAACIWASLDQDRAAARRALAQKVAYYGHALSPLIYERLGVTREDFRPIEHALMVERDEARVRPGMRP